MPVYFRKPISKAMKSMSAKLFTKPELVLLRISCVKEFTGSVPDGAVSASGRVLGTYVHGFFDNDAFRHAFLAAARRAVDLSPAETWVNVGAEREARIDRLADHLRKSLDMNLIRSWIVAPPTR